MKKLLAALLTTFFCISANAACNIKSLKGGYSIGVVSSNQNQTCSAIGQVVFDGNGKARVITASGCGSDIKTDNYVADYEIYPSTCMGFLSYQNSTAYFVMDNALKVGQFFMSSNNAIAYGSILKQ